MTLLADFKTTIGVSGSTNDQYYIDYYLRPAIDKASALSKNYKITTVTLSSGVLTYDMTDSSIASPVVADSGIQDLVIDGDYVSTLRYGTDYYIKDLTNLYIMDTQRTNVGSITFKYNAYYSKPTVTPTETDAPSTLFPAIIKYAEALYRLSQLRDKTTGGISSKSEDGLSVSYGSITEQELMINKSIEEAEDEMRFNGGISKSMFYSVQIV